MDWEQWAEQHPPKLVLEEPVGRPHYDDYVAAVVVADNMEEQSDTAYEVVQYADRFYVIAKG